MSELQKIKRQIVSQLHLLCAHCATGSSRPHRCPIRDLTSKVDAINGIPLMVGGQFKGVLLPHL